MAQYIINRNLKGGTIATTVALQMIASIPGMHMPLADCEEPTRDLLVTADEGSEKCQQRLLMIWCSLCWTSCGASTSIILIRKRPSS